VNVACYEVGYFASWKALWNACFLFHCPCPLRLRRVDATFCKHANLIFYAQKLI
jgi:hypothetical protein